MANSFLQCMLYHWIMEGAANRIIYFINNTVKNIRPYCMCTRQAVISDTGEDDSVGVRAPHKPYTLKRSTLASTNTREEKKYYVSNGCKYIQSPYL
jgi:hypothetical protein